MRIPLRSAFALSILAATAAVSQGAEAPWTHGPLGASADGRRFQHRDETPFFWLGDTAWLITQKLNREEVRAYFENRRAKGFNVVQCCVVQFLDDKSFNGSAAILENDISKLRTTPGNKPTDAVEYDYWDHLDYILDTAAANNIYLAMAPVWSHMVRRTPLSADKVRNYVEQLAARYKDRPNIIWLNGGSAKGDQNADVWQAIGETLEKQGGGHLIGFHPFGRTQSSTWFNESTWLDFNLFTSGHRRYDQDVEGRKIGEDNWRYVLEDLAKTPVRPTLDSEPAYENTPQGLHDHTQPYWGPADVRRYAWWSVFAGAAGHTYGENSVRQVYIPKETKPASGAKGFIMDRLDTEGAGQLRHLKSFVEGRPTPLRINAQALVEGDEGEKHERVLVCRGDGWVAAYTHTGRKFTLHLEKTSMTTLKATWLNPRTGERTEAGIHTCKTPVTFDPPGEQGAGNDWVLVLDDAAATPRRSGTETAVTPQKAATNAGPKWDSSLLKNKAQWFATTEARAAADTVLRYQSSEGAWPKNTNLLAPATEEEMGKIAKGGKANTIDNGATTMPIRFLALVAQATQAEPYKAAVARGVEYLIKSQYPNGGFPQFYPLRKGYYAHITYNDGAMISALIVLRDVASGNEPYRFLDEALRARAAQAVDKGIACILRTQVRQNGRGTVWCAQHDETTLAPTWARAYEPPSLSGCESVAIVRFLMAIKTPTIEIRTAVEDAIAWFETAAIRGHRLDRIKRADGRNERLLVPDPSAPLLWARFYELGTNRPLYMDRHSAPLYDYAQVDYERRSGYNYHGDWAASLLAEEFPAWRARIALKP